MKGRREYEKKQFCGNDFGDDRGNLICTGNVYVPDTGMGCIPAGSCNGSYRGSGIADYGSCVEKDGT